MVWAEWAPPVTIVRSAKRVGISEDGLDVEWMQTEKFESAKLCTESLSTPATTCRHLTSWCSHKFEEIEIDKVPGLLKVKKVKPVTNKKTSPSSSSSV